MIFIPKFTKERNSKQNIGEVTVLNLCTLSVNFYICTKFHENVSKGLKVIERTRVPS